MNWIFVRIFVIFTSILSSQAQNYAGKLVIDWTFSNPGHKLSNGDLCDPYNYQCETYIVFCISSRFECDVGSYTTTKKMENSGTIFGSFDLNVPASYRGSQLRFTAKAYDHDVYDSHDFIGGFRSRKMYIFMPGQDTPVKMDREPSQNEAALNLKVKMLCEEGFYDASCGKKCTPNEGFYTCDDNGNRVCVPGKLPPDCQLDDACVKEPCAKGAKCENLESGGRRCTCDATDESKCYKHTPCVPNPCQNGAKCSPSPTNKFDDICYCPENYAGRRCDSPRDACAEEAFRLMVQHNDSINQKFVNTFSGFNLSTISLTKNASLLANVYGALSDPEMKLNYMYVCQNGGQCMETKGIQRLSWSCQCPSGWSGIHCEINDTVSDKKHEFNWMIIAIMVGTCLLVTTLSCIIFLALRHKRRQANKRLAQNREEIYSRNQFHPGSPGMIYTTQGFSPMIRNGLPPPSLSYHNSTIHYRNPHESHYGLTNYYPTVHPMMKVEDDGGYLEVSQLRTSAPHIRPYSMEDEYTDISSMLGAVNDKPINLPPAPAPPLAEPNSQRSLPEIPPVTPTKESPANRPPEDEYLITTPLLSSEKLPSGEQNDQKSP